ncbi:L,D-transpeptidase family protein [Cytophaga aurantiaca]|uniref:L,D-transpeptidase family protein n=1 Tax=Cytophaga aurantiaca TaxID=29530 RepID=UPI0003802E04|nr:L,D-transpeptidase family protein [Cytophaga aurantiaca]
MLKNILVLLIVAGVSVGCSKKVVPAKTTVNVPEIIKDPVAVFTKDGFETSKDFITNKIQTADTNATGIVAKSSIYNATNSIFTLYKKNEYQPFWVNQKRVEEAIAVLKDSEYDGLDPDEYNYKTLESIYKTYQEDGKIDETEALDLELMLTAAIYKYTHHLHFGKVDPVAIYPEWNYQRPSKDLITDSLLVIYFNKNVDEIPVRFRPQIAFYNSLRNALVDVDSLIAKGYVAEEISYIGKKLIKGDTSFVILEVKKKLHATTQYNSGELNNIFDEQLYQSVKIFQQHVGLHATGIIDKATIVKLNYTPAEIRNTIRANMERCRWFSNDFPDEYILVNIPDYTLSHFKNGKLVYNETVIVGKQLSQTPVFQATISNVEFNPYWTVPRSIAVKELLPSLKKDPGYLAKHNMFLYDGEKEIATPASFAGYSDSYFPFTIKEKPGPQNSLGQVKFSFPNPYSIYMHDTPAKYLFDNDIRSYSHGCIRLHNPLKFAEHLLSQQGVTQKQIDEIVLSEKNYIMALENKMPIMISYFTCYTKRGDNYLYFFYDVYGSDKKIIEGLKR